MNSEELLGEIEDILRTMPPRQIKGSENLKFYLCRLPCFQVFRSLDFLVVCTYTLQCVKIRVYTSVRRNYHGYQSRPGRQAHRRGPTHR